MQAGLLAVDDVLCTMDSDGQHLTQDLLALIALRDDIGFEVVQGVRAVASPSRLRRAGNRVLTRYARLLTGIPFEDVECGMRCISVRIVPDVLRFFRGDGYGVGQELAGCFRAAGARIHNSTPIRLGRIRHRTKATDSLVALRSGLATRWRIHRERSVPRELGKPRGYRIVGRLPNARPEPAT